MYKIYKNKKYGNYAIIIYMNDSITLYIFLNSNSIDSFLNIIKYTKEHHLEKDDLFNNETKDFLERYDFITEI